MIKIYEFNKFSKRFGLRFLENAFDYEMKELEYRKMLDFPSISLKKLFL